MIRLSEMNLLNQRVFLRADLNVPIFNGKIENDFKLESILNTLNFLIEHQAKIILATHLGRPQKKDSNFSNKILLNWFEKRNYKIHFEPNLEIAYEKSKKLKAGEILLLENLRFFEGEDSGIPIIRENFAQTLFKLADFYINDAWGILHKNETSLTNLAKLYNYQNRSLGFLIEKELIHLNKLKDNKVLFILGGAKVKTKLPIIEQILDKSQAILLCPAIVFPFLKALGKTTGNSLIKASLAVSPTVSLIKLSKEIMKKAQKNKIEILIPNDYYISETLDSKNLIYSNSDEIPENMIGITVGPKTINKFTQEINKAKAIFVNGPMGFADKPESMESFKKLLQAVAQSTAYSVVGGGDSVAAAYLYKFQNNIDFCSTGGGSTLAYLAGQRLSGLEPFLK